MFTYLFQMTNWTWHQSIFKYAVYVSYILYIITFMGIFKNSPEYLTVLDNIIKYYVCIVLLIRFNPFIKNIKIDNKLEFDRKIAFSAGIFLLFTTTVSTIAQQFFSMEFNKLYSHL